MAEKQSTVGITGFKRVGSTQTGDFTLNDLIGLEEEGGRQAIIEKLGEEKTKELYDSITASLSKVVKFMLRKKELQKIAPDDVYKTWWEKVKNLPACTALLDELEEAIKRSKPKEYLPVDLERHKGREIIPIDLEAYQDVRDIT
ncbi:hypothetical protein IBX65_08310, partial [Candidatus Aerophobetes bacterium]|nr:hypothetical protein [Candidatus Aerophobetes bacterium]